ncbi:30S ribosomal protein S21 [bacterium]|nr:30S ribosomal protein S21 [bacterium]NUM80419.1 30S ribosomal protein S21 [bacterium]
MITVQVGENESFDKALKRFKRKCLQSGLMRTLRETAHYTKPSERKKADRLRAIRKQRQIQAEEGY